MKMATMEAINNDICAKIAKNAFLGMDSGPPLDFRFSTPRRGASHHWQQNPSAAELLLELKALRVICLPFVL